MDLIAIAELARLLLLPLPLFRLLFRVLFRLSFCVSFRLLFRLSFRLLFRCSVFRFVFRFVFCFVFCFVFRSYFLIVTIQNPHFLFGTFVFLRMLLAHAGFGDGFNSNRWIGQRLLLSQPLKLHTEKSNSAPMKIITRFSKRLYFSQSTNGYYSLKWKCMWNQVKSKL